MIVKSRRQKSLKDQRLTYAEIMEAAFLQVTNNELKPEVAVRLAWKIANSIDFDDSDLMHMAPQTRAEWIVGRIKDEGFINGVNNYKEL